MIAHAREHRNVIRLKSGDPLVFGRATEEIAALVNAGVAFEVVQESRPAFARQHSWAVHSLTAKAHRM